MVLSLLWALVFIMNGNTKVDGIGQGDWMIALAPLVIGQALGKLGSWVLWGK